MLLFPCRIFKYACCSNECFILALIYIDRLIQRNNFLLTELNVHRVVITAILLAAKFFDDAYYNNAYYSKVGGVLVSEMNGLEVDFLFRINFSLHVKPEVFEKYKAELVAHSIHAGLAAVAALASPAPSPASMHQPTLPQIAEALETVANATPESILAANANNAYMMHQQQQQQQQQFVAVSAAAAAPVLLQVTPSTMPQVTPSPSYSHHQQQLDYSGMTVPIHSSNLPQLLTQQESELLQQQLLQQQFLQASVQTPVALASNNTLHFLQLQQQQALYVPSNQATQEVSVPSPFAPVGGSDFNTAVMALSQQEVILQQQQENAFLQRANSMPPIPSQPTPFGGCAVDYARNPPHSAPVLASNLALPMINGVDQDQYQMVMNQLFPIQTTLVHHNHAAGVASAGVPSGTAVDHHHHHHQSTSSAAGGGTGNFGSVMAYQ